MEGNGVRRSKVEVGQVKSSCNVKGKEEKVFRSWVELSRVGVEWRVMEYEEVKWRWDK